jgi:hypothetical protein
MIINTSPIPTPNLHFNRSRNSLFAIKVYIVAKRIPESLFGFSLIPMQCWSVVIRKESEHHMRETGKVLTTENIFFALFYCLVYGIKPKGAA